MKPMFVCFSRTSCLENSVQGLVLQKNIQLELMRPSETRDPNNFSSGERI